MADETSAAIFQVFISSAVAIACAFMTVRPSVRSSEKAQLRQRLGELLKLGIERPFLEDVSFIAKWPSMPVTDEKRIQYDLYCCSYFNLLEDIYDFFGRSPDKVKKFIGIEEIVTIHAPWWNDGRSVKGNMAAYQQSGFTDFIDEMAGSLKEGKGRT